MVKTRYTRHKRNKTRIMKGGSLSQEDIRELREEGFTTNQIDSLQDLGVSLYDIMQRVNRIRNDPSFQGDPDYMTEQVIVEVLNENIFDSSANHLAAIPHDPDDIHDLDISGSLDDTISSQGTMNLNELNISNRSSDSGYTTSEDRSFDEFGGKKRRKFTRKNNRKNNRKNTSNIKRKTRRNNIRKLNLKGGMYFGRGVGANSYDPNFSIYNTNMLNLFPYKP
jgi:hypothetical protein